LTAFVVNKAGLGRDRRDILFVAGLLCVGVILLFVRLNDAYLWQDEAETALVSRHLLAYGLPLSTDGTDWVQQSGESFGEFTEDYVWIYHSWLQYALTAASFALLGPTTLAARLPFAVAGLATVGLAYVLAARWLVDKRTARVATILLLLCVPFLLLMRQCRYYALAGLFTLLTLDAYLRLASDAVNVPIMDNAWLVPYFVLSATLLYHSHYGAFFPTLAALVLDLLIFRRLAARVARVWFVSSMLLIGLLVLPWALFMRVWDRGQPLQADRFLGHLGQHAVYATGWLWPLLLVPLGALVYRWLRVAVTKRPRGAVTARNRYRAAAALAFARTAVLIITVNILFLSASAAFDWVFFRYWTHLIPLLFTLLAAVVVWVVQRWPLLGLGLLAMLLVCNGLHLVPYGLPGVKHVDPSAVWPGSPAFEALADVWSKASRFRSDVWMYAQELTHDYEGPNEGLVAYLSAHAQPGQTVAVNYEDLPLMFYLDLRVLGGLSAHGLSGHALPDWVINRKHGPYGERLMEIVDAGSYQQIEIPYPDIRWENRPQPGEHHYLTVQSEDHVILYRRQGD
jgi:4-amino-4-deoxy-L-arabinose transferase-like glycosyltransferase